MFEQEAARDEAGGEIRAAPAGRLRQQARQALRSATAGHHQRVDAAFSGAALDDRDDYGRFLLAQAGAFLPVERALDDAGVAHVVADWPKRRRTDALLRDLASLGLIAPAGEPLAALEGAPAMLGAVYVLEGSRLGGAMLRRSVPAAFPTAFLSGGGSVEWRKLLALLDERLHSAADMSMAIDAACETFSLFERSGRSFLKGKSR